MGALRTIASGRDSVPVIVAVLVVVNAIGLAIALIGEMPAEFDGVGDPSNVLGEAPVRGTLLSAPFGPIVILVVCALLSRMVGWLSVIGLLGVIAICVLFTVGILGEPLHPEASDPPVAFLVAWRVILLGLASMAIGLCLLRLYRRVR